MNYADYLLRKIKEHNDTFFTWFSAYQVDAVSGVLPAGQTEYGFPLPTRPADALWYSPSEEEERHASAPVSPLQYELWQEEEIGVMLAIKQCADIVLGMDHFAWFRIPLPAIAQYMRAHHDDLPKTVAALIREGASFRPQGFGHLYRDGKTCSLGCGLEALYGKGGLDLPGRLPYSTDFAARLLARATGQKMFTWVRHPMKQTTWPVYAIILELNDVYKWSREQIAEWLETQPL